MTELALSQVLNLAVFLALPFFGGLIATKLNIPKMIGYIVSGIFLGFLMQGKTGESLPLVANFGLIMLLFTIGLEINIRSLTQYGKLITSIGLIQIVITMVIFGLTTFVFGFSFTEALIVSFALSLSSTAVVSKFIQDEGEEHSVLGGMTIGILVLQDIVVIPFMIIMTSLKGDSTFGLIAQDILFSLGRAALVLALIYYATRNFIPFIFEKIARVSRELLNILTLFFIVIAIFIFSYLGLSPAIAAFASGVLISGTLQHYQIFSQMRPLRDIFTILFFVFLGASVQVGDVIPKLPLILIFASFIMVVKFAVITLLYMYNRFHTKTAFTTGILLAQVGEFAFIVLHNAFENGLIEPHRYTIALASTLITIGVSPLFMSRKDALYIRLRLFVRKNFPTFEKHIAHAVDREPGKAAAIEMANHVLICGYGRVGGYIGRALMLAKIPYMAIDYNYHIVQEQKKRGVTIMYGDPTDIDILKFAQAETALAVILAVPDAFSQETITLHVKTLAPQARILSRIAGVEHQQRMRDLGANIIIQPEFEAALSMIKKILMGFNMPENEILGKIKRLKIEHGMM